MPLHLAEGIAAKVFSIEIDVAGVKTLGKLASTQDIDIETLGKGLILRSPNGHRWRLLVSDTGVFSGVDLDA